MKMELIARGDGLLIRKMEDSERDLRIFLGWMTDPQTMCYWDGMTEKYTYERVARQYRRHAREGVEQCFIELNGVPVGYCQFYCIDGAGELEAPEEQYGRFVSDGERVFGVDMLIEPELRGHGTGSRALDMLCGALFERFGADIVTVDPKPHLR